MILGKDVYKTIVIQNLPQVSEQEYDALKDRLYDLITIHNGKRHFVNKIITIYLPLVIVVIDSPRRTVPYCLVGFTKAADAKEAVHLIHKSKLDTGNGSTFTLKATLYADDLVGRLEQKYLHNSMVEPYKVIISKNSASLIFHPLRKKDILLPAKDYVTTIMINNLPIVPESQFNKLIKVIHNLVTICGTLKEDALDPTLNGICMPFIHEVLRQDSTTTNVAINKSAGFCLLITMLMS
jgi:hypothetical protein